MWGKARDKSGRDKRTSTTTSPPVKALDATSYGIQKSELVLNLMDVWSLEAGGRGRRDVEGKDGCIERTATRTTCSVDWEDVGGCGRRVNQVALSLTET